MSDRVARLVLLISIGLLGLWFLWATGFITVLWTTLRFIFIGLVPVDPGTLLPMIVAAGLGAWLGSGLVGRA